MKIIRVGRKEVVTIFLGFLVLTSIVAWASANLPKIEQFASLSVLGSRMSAAFYFPNNDTTVSQYEKISWTVQVYNHMGTAQLFLVEVKLANQTIGGPNATSNFPNQGIPVLRSYRALLSNETWNLPLIWSVTGETRTAGTNPSTTIQSMMVNSDTTNGIGVSAISGKNFRIVLELWSYDVQLHGFTFSFASNGVPESVFNQIWFDSQ